MLKVKNLNFFYSKNEIIFSNLSFEVNKGKVIGINGSNGSGKTTLIKCLCGVLKFQEGTILLNGDNIANQKKSISSILYENDLFEYMTIYDNVLFFMDFYDKKVDKSYLAYLLHRYGLYEYRDKIIFECSTGTIKKCQIIISLLLSPKLLLGDEASNSLDEESREKFFIDIKELAEKNNSIVILSGNNLTILENNCEKIFFIENKKLKTQKIYYKVNNLN